MPTKKSKPTVKIWFEGLPQPIPARAESMTDSQLLTVELPYLRRNTEVFISDADGHSRKGYMTEVSLVAGPEPKLQLLVQTGQPVFEPISELPLMSDEGGGLESVELTDEPASLESDLEHRTSTIPLLTPLADDGAPEAPPAALPILEGAADDGEEAQPERRADDRRRQQRRLTTRLHAPPQELERPPSRRWWGLGALALVLVGGAAMYYHEEVQRPAMGVAEAAARPPAEPAPSPQPAPQPETRPAVAPAVVKPEAKKPETNTSAAKGVDRPAPAEERPPVDRSAPRVWLGGKHPVLVVPIEGSTRGAESYILAHPEGVAVNLPHARLGGLKTMYKFEAGAFHLLNVWGRKGGVHLRLFFHGKMPPHKLHFGPDAVRCTVFSR